MAAPAAGTPGLNQQELKELRRVYDLLCGFAEKERVEEEMAPLRDEKARLENAIRLGAYDAEMQDADAARTRLDEVDAALDAHEAALARMAEAPGQTIGVEDLCVMLARLGRKTPQREVLEMIWEVDENLDGRVDWDEFRIMFQRNLNDKTGLEAHQLFDMVMFLTYDEDNSGAVSVDETMNMIYARYGRDQMDEKMRELFGDNINAPSEELTFANYLRAVSVRGTPPPPVATERARRIAGRELLEAEDSAGGAGGAGGRRGSGARGRRR